MIRVHLPLHSMHSEGLPRAVAVQRIGSPSRTATTHIPRYRLRVTGRGFATELCCPEAYSSRAEHVLSVDTYSTNSLAASPQTFQTFSIHLFFNNDRSADILGVGRLHPHLVRPVSSHSSEPRLFRCICYSRLASSYRNGYKLAWRNVTKPPQHDRPRYQAFTLDAAHYARPAQLARS